MHCKLGMRSAIEAAHYSILTRKWRFTAARKGVSVTKGQVRAADAVARAESRPTEAELSALAGFRAALRKFLAFSEQAAADQGVTMQWYQALLVIKTFFDLMLLSASEN